MEEIKQEEIRVKEVFDKFIDSSLKNKDDINSVMECVSILLDELIVKKETIMALKHLVESEDDSKRKALYEIVYNTMIEVRNGER